jgi:hypothetical protein
MNRSPLALNDPAVHSVGRNILVRVTRHTVFFDIHVVKVLLCAAAVDSHQGANRDGDY